MSPGSCRRSMTMALFAAEAPMYEWPPPRALILMLSFAANSTALRTSSVDFTVTTAAGVESADLGVKEFLPRRDWRLGESRVEDILRRAVLGAGRQDDSAIDRVIEGTPVLRTRHGGRWRA